VAGEEEEYPEEEGVTPSHALKEASREPLGQAEQHSWRRSTVVVVDVVAVIVVVFR
jgi:hypothetical protein